METGHSKQCHEFYFKMVGHAGQAVETEQTIKYGKNNELLLCIWIHTYILFQLPDLEFNFFNLESFVLRCMKQIFFVDCSDVLWWVNVSVQPTMQLLMVGKRERLLTSLRPADLAFLPAPAVDLVSCSRVCGSLWRCDFDISNTPSSSTFNN